MGAWLNVSVCKFEMYKLNPLERDKTRAIPIIPILPAKPVKKVLPFLVKRFLKLSLIAVQNDMEVFSFFLFTPTFVSELSSEISLANTCFSLIFSESAPFMLLFFFAVILFTVLFPSSETTFPSRKFIILELYSSASAPLCVTIITSFSSAIFFKSSIICSLVSLSNAPVGSSARIISGLFTSALAIATLCICPPESWFGLLFNWFSKPTFSRAILDISFLFFAWTPPIVKASSTFSKTVRWEIRL